MGENRNRLMMAIRPQGVEKDVPAATRIRFAIQGATALTPVTPETNPDLYIIVQEVSQKAGIPTPKVYIWQSKKPTANAVAMPTKQPTIAFSQDILKLLNKDELAAVTAHELGHVRNMNEMGKNFWLASIGGFALGHVVAKPIEKRGLIATVASGDRTPKLLGDVAGDLLRVGGTLIGGAVATRAEERSADRYSGHIMQGDAVPLLSALEKLGEFHHTSKTGPKGLVKRLLSSHPNFETRREALGVSQEAITAYRQSHDAQSAFAATPRPSPVMLESPASLPVAPASAADLPAQEAQQRFSDMVRQAQQVRQQQGDWASRTSTAEQPSASFSR